MSTRDLIPEIGDRTARMIERAIVPASQLRRILGQPLYVYDQQQTVSRPRPPVTRRDDRSTCPHCGRKFLGERGQVWCSIACGNRGRTRIGRPPHPVPLQAIERIQAIVAGVFCVPISAFTAVSSRREFSHPRHAAMALCRQILGASLHAVGRSFGPRHHSTVVHAERSAAKRRADTTGKWADWCARYREAEEKCRAAVG